MLATATAPHARCSGGSSGPVRRRCAASAASTSRRTCAIGGAARGLPAQQRALGAPVLAAWPPGRVLGTAMKSASVALRSPAATSGSCTEGPSSTFAPAYGVFAVGVRVLTPTSTQPSRCICCGCRDKTSAGIAVECALVLESTTALGRSDTSRGADATATRLQAPGTEGEPPLPRSGEDPSDTVVAVEGTAPAVLAPVAARTCRSSAATMSAKLALAAGLPADRHAAGGARVEADGGGDEGTAETPPPPSLTAVETAMARDADAAAADAVRMVSTRSSCANSLRKVASWSSFARCVASNGVCNTQGDSENVKPVLVRSAALQHAGLRHRTLHAQTERSRLSCGIPYLQGLQRLHLQ